MRCCSLTSGKLRHKINLQRQAETPDGGGGTVLAWATFASPRAWVKPMSGGERFHSMRLEANTTHRIFVRYRTDLLTSDRIEFGGRLFQIRAIINIEERNRWLEIYADEGVAV